MVPRVRAIAIDCNDLEVQAAFWSALLGMKVTERGERWWELEPVSPDGPVLCLQKVPEGKAVKNRLHLDLHVPDFESAGERGRELGATYHWSPEEGGDFQVWLDPEGNEFCFVVPEEN
ncbi:VOC family protein [Actinomadura logoneensis]|uniref:VOC family protein n=1 Tax=Actinomadura logoneensis TaxID=2293572 RepID=A0A372JKE0_9ACTN|nr:VOC family protein [Actinomadura logoneensis]RFU40276.1 VOC family protein [Actinomadura logoneensis]